MDMQQVSLSVEDTKKALQHDARFFINFFMGDLLTTQVPDLHVELLDLMADESVKQLILAVPRGHAKTTIAKLTCVYYFLFTDFKYILYMSNTASVSIPCVNDVIGFLTCDNFRAIFGEIEFHIKQEGKGKYVFTLPDGKRCTLYAFSAGQQVRGTNIANTRPELVIVDDLEDNDNIATKELAEKLKRWFVGPFKKCTAKKNKWIWIGNLISEQSMLYENINSTHWHSRLYGCIKEDGTSLWEGLWNIAELRQDYAEYEEIGMADVWFAEMMNMPMAGVDGIIQASELQYAPQQVQHPDLIGFITIDLASSQETWAHETVLACHVYDSEGEFFQIVETSSYKGMDPVKLFPHLMSICYRWGVNIIGIESVSYQATAKPVFEHMCMTESIQGIEFVQIPTRAQKFFRLTTWAGLLKAGTYRLTEGDFAVTQQLLAYNPKKRENADDIIDACAHGVWMIGNMLTKIMHQKHSKTHGETAMQNSYQVSRF